MRSSRRLANVRQEVLEIPAALRETLIKGHAEYEALLRETRWGQGPLYIVGSGRSFIVGLAGARAFEAALARPVICRPANDFRAYSTALVQQHPVLLAISYSGGEHEILEAVRAARRRGAKVLAVTGSTTNELATISQGVFLVRAGEEPGFGVKVSVCEQAAITYISLLSSRLSQRPDARVASRLMEFEKLPEQAEWVLLKIQDAIRSFAAELNTAKTLVAAGAGFYHPVALQWARLMARLGTTRAVVADPGDFLQFFSDVREPESSLVVLSGSQCRLKRELHEFVASSRKSISRILAITDANDRDLIDSSSLAVLLPPLDEMIGSLLALIALCSAACEDPPDRSAL